MTKFSRGHLAAAKLTPMQVKELRELYNQGWTQAALSRRYGITVVQIGRICRGEAWQRYHQDPHPDQIEHQQAMMGNAEPVPMSQETIDKLRKELAAIPPMPETTAAQDPLDAYLKPKGEGS